MSYLPKISDPDLAWALKECTESTKLTGKLLFPERFDMPFSAAHQQIFEALDSPHQLVAIAAPRGFGKTTLGMVKTAKAILFREKNFIVPISCTATQAIQISENLKRELLTNPMIRGTFGPIESSEFTKEAWRTADGIMVMPRGSGQQVRGLLSDIHRPDLILCDDLESKEAVANEEQREKLKRWFFTDVLNSVRKYRHNWQVIVIGTVLHQASLLQDLLSDPDWHSIRLELCDDQCNPTWPEAYTREDILKLKASYERLGILDEFYKEYRNLPVAEETAGFTRDMFKYYKEPIPLKDPVETVVIVDPAKSVNPKSDYTAITAIGITPDKIMIREPFIKRVHPEEGIHQALDMVSRFHASALAVEVTGLNEFVTWPYKDALVRSGLECGWVELKARGRKKEDRIKALIPLYREGRVHHAETRCHKLEEQLLSFPFGRHDDGPDCIAYVIELLEQGDRYFFAPKQMENLGTPDLGDWRTAP